MNFQQEKLIKNSINWTKLSWMTTIHIRSYKAQAERVKLTLSMFHIEDSWTHEHTGYRITHIKSFKLSQLSRREEKKITVGRVALALGPTFLDGGPGGTWRLAAIWLSFSEKSRSDLMLPSCSGEKLPLSLYINER